MSPRAELPPRAAATSLSAALGRLFESVPLGIYIGAFEGESDATVAANPHLKLMFGHAPEADAAAVRPFEPQRFVDPLVRAAFFARLERDGAVTDYLLRLRRADETPFWAEVTAAVDGAPDGAGDGCRHSCGTSASAGGWRTRTGMSPTRCSRRRSWQRSGRPFPAWPTS